MFRGSVPFRRCDWSEVKEIYDLKTDPHETTNLAGTPAAAAIQKTLAARLDGWRPSVTQPDSEAPGQFLKPPLAARPAAVQQ